ncbi:MAG: hypothetical protein WKF79_03345 [Nocardioides sp.]
MRRRLPPAESPDGTPIPPNLLAPDYGGQNPHPDPGAVSDAWRQARAAWSAAHGWPGGEEVRWQEESDAISLMPPGVFRYEDI